VGVGSSSIVVVTRMASEWRQAGRHEKKQQQPNKSIEALKNSGALPLSQKRGKAVDCWTPGFERERDGGY